jgi:hypothetical protein
MADEAPTLQQYSTQLNVYNADLSDRGRLSVNASDAFEISYRTGLGSVLIRNLSYQTGDAPEDIHNIDTEMYNINVKCDTNRFNSDTALETLTTAVVTERTRAMTEEKKNSDSLTSEVAARTSAVSSVATDLAVEAAARISDVVALQQLMANESTARGAADVVHTSSIALASFNLGLEAKRADDEEKRLSNLIAAEAAARLSTDSATMVDVVAYNGRALTAEAGLQASITAETAARGLALDQAQSGAATALGIEAARALSAEAALASRIDQVLSNITPQAIDSFTEVVTALGAGGVGGLAGAINTADSRALAAEADLQAQISALLAAMLALQAPH